jgi:hypothetical protein
VNTQTGAVYELSEAFAESLAQGEPSEALASLKHDFMALEDVRRGDPVVPVSREVATVVRLGQREKQRRRRRAKAARAARKRNR